MDMVVVIDDVSGSMQPAWSEVKEYGLELAQRVLSDWRVNSRVGLLAFDHNPSEVHALTTDFAQLTRSLDQFQPTWGLTIYSSALTFALQMFGPKAAPGRKRVVVFQTDGAPNTDDLQPTLRKVAELQQAGVTLICSFVGSDDPSLLKQMVQNQLHLIRVGNVQALRQSLSHSVTCERCFIILYTRTVKRLTMFDFSSIKKSNRMV